DASAAIFGRPSLGSGAGPPSAWGIAAGLGRSATAPPGRIIDRPAAFRNPRRVRSSLIAASDRSDRRSARSRRWGLVPIPSRGGAAEGRRWGGWTWVSSAINPLIRVPRRPRDRTGFDERAYWSTM